MSLGFPTRSYTTEDGQRLETFGLEHILYYLLYVAKENRGADQLCGLCAYANERHHEKTNILHICKNKGASGSEGRGFAPRPRHTKNVKNGTGSSLADARNKRVVLGRYKNAGRYLLLFMSQ